jgi:FkbM family methyltransferase
LARVLRPWERGGHWIDVGAGHPTFDSVTKLFSEFGWTGVNIEPLTTEYELLQTERPQDLNLNVGISSTPGTALLYEGPEDSRGTSSFLQDLAHVGDIGLHKSTPVKMLRLDSIIEAYSSTIDFIKIDVEGMEKEVISSIDWGTRPTGLVIVEATAPNSFRPTHHLWELELLSTGYECVLFDGLNRFYKHVDFDFDGDHLWFPASSQDQFISFREFSCHEAAKATVLENELLNRSLQEAINYAKSLEQERSRKDLSLQEAINYAKSLEQERLRDEKTIADLRLVIADQAAQIAENAKFIAKLRDRLERLSGHA